MISWRLPLKLPAIDANRDHRLIVVANRGPKRGNRGCNRACNRDNRAFICLYMQGRLLIVLIASLIDADARCSITF